MENMDIITKDAENNQSIDNKRTIENEDLLSIAKYKYIKLEESNKVIENNISQSKQELLTRSLLDFFQSPSNFVPFFSIIKGYNELSLRILDWFVTNHSKKNNIMYPINDNQFIVYFDYKAQLKAYSKKQFDPFCRRDRLILAYEIELEDGTIEKDSISTTVGQLNFFRWCLLYKIIKYVEENLTTIENDMYNSCKRVIAKKKRCGEEGRKRRTELSRSATKSVSKHSVSVTISFD